MENQELIEKWKSNPYDLITFLRSHPDALKFFKDFITEKDEFFKNLKTNIYEWLLTKKTAKEKCVFLRERINVFKEAKLQNAADIHKNWTPEQKIRDISSMQMKYENLISFCQDLLNENSTTANNLVKSNIKKNKAKKDIQTELKNLFINVEEFKHCIAVLKIVEPPIIDAGFRYLLGVRQKGAFVAWCEVLKKRGKIRSVKDDEFSKLLNKQFKNLELGKDGRTLRNTRTTAYNKYYKDFLNLIT